MNHRELERGYFDALRATGWPKHLIIDNGSDPPLPNAVRVGWNSGYNTACNIGLEQARTDAVLFLNNDIEPRTQNWLDAITDALEPGVLVGAQLVTSPHANVDGIELPYLDGWCVGGMREDLDDLGGWYEGFEGVGYFGDNDLSLRARAAGMTLREVRVGLNHLRNRTAGPANENHEVSLRNQQQFKARARELLVAA